MKLPSVYLKMSVLGAVDTVPGRTRHERIHNVAAIRAIVDPSLLDRLILPYDRLLKRGRVVHDRAVAIEDGAVRLETNGSISGDIVVIATGSSYAHPFKA